MQSRFLVDPEDEWLLTEFTWHVNDWGYARTAVKQTDGSYRGVLMHRMILNPRESETVDHINGDKLDNRKSNLRIAPPWQNKGPYKGRRFKGVYAENGKFRAQLKFGSKTHYIGFFATEEEAALAVNKKAEELEIPFFRFNEV